MEIKERNVILILVLIIALIIIGVSIYNQQIKQEEIILEEVIEEEPTQQETKQQPENTTKEEIITIIVEEQELPKEVVIQISRFEFDKPEITIEPGTKVIWNNTDTRRHMITNKRIGLFRHMRKSLEFGDTFEYTFNEEGVYEILEANFGINGKVIVEKKDPNLITGQIIRNIEVNGISFLLISINLLVITALALVIGFWISKHQKEFS